MVPDACMIGDGHRIRVTGLTHDERCPVMNPKAQDTLIAASEQDPRPRRGSSATKGGIENDAGEMIADVVVLPTASLARAERVAMARARGQRACRLVVAWRFPAHPRAGPAACLIMVELNLGQMYFEMERVVPAAARRAWWATPGARSTSRK